MAQLTEVRHVQQVPGEPGRRWFSSDNLGLIVWCDDAGSPIAFRLCHDKGRSERALTWTPDRGFSHMAIDDGEEGVGIRHKSTPVLVADGIFHANRVCDLFAESSAQLPPEIVEFVAAKLREPPN
jgi:hypothetical protein